MSVYKIDIRALMKLCVVLLSSVLMVDSHAQSFNSQPSKGALPNLITNNVSSPDPNDEWVVVLKDPRPARLRGYNIKGYGAKHYANSPVLKRYGKRVSRDHRLGLKKAWFIESLNVYCLIVDIQGSDDAVLESLKADKRVEWVQKSNSFSLLSASSTSANHNNISLDKALDRQAISTIDGAGVQIALIDSAVSKTHPDLASSITQTYDLVIGAGQSSTLSGPELKTRGEYHGTAMAGIVVASPSNDLGLAGVAPEAKIVAYRGCWELLNGDTQCNTLSLARALDGVAQSGASILNLSLSGPEDALLDKLVDVLLKKGVFVVAAFDPQRPNMSRFPSRRDGVLIVRAEHLNQNFNAEFTAPGQRIVVSPNTGYKLMTGHSVATAYTTGVLALLAQRKANVLGSEVTHADAFKQSLSRADVSSAADLLKIAM